MKIINNEPKFFKDLPFMDRLHIYIRTIVCPFNSVLARIPVSGTIADVGCGHGLLCALAVLEKPSRKLIGIDPDKRKIEVAKRCFKNSNVELMTGTIEDLPTGLDAAVMCDVLYLIPVREWSNIFTAILNRLKPGGRFVLKEAGTEPAWKHMKTILGKYLMVNLLGRTRASGGLNFQASHKTQRLLELSGFKVEEVRDLGKGYSTPHVLFVASRPIQG